MVYAGANASSFQAASRALLELADITITPERVRRATTRHGKERCEVSERLTKAFLGKDIPQQMHQGPADKAAPSLAVVMSDGGRYQRLERNEKPLQTESHWKESRIAVLLTMQSMAHESDPAPELPEFLQDVSIAKKLAEIGDIGGENPHPNSHVHSRRASVATPRVAEQRRHRKWQELEGIWANSRQCRMVCRVLQG